MSGEPMELPVLTVLTAARQLVGDPGDELEIDDDMELRDLLHRSHLGPTSGWRSWSSRSQATGSVAVGELRLETTDAARTRPARHIHTAGCHW